MLNTAVGHHEKGASVNGNSAPLSSASKNDEALKQILVNFKQSNESLLDQDLIIWPESALPTLQSNISGYLDDIDAELKRHHVGLLVGIPTNSDANHYYNSVLGVFHCAHTGDLQMLVRADGFTEPGVITDGE